MSKHEGKVLGLYHALKGVEGRHEYEEIEIDDQGILGDKYYGKNLNRTILITSEEASYVMAAAEGITMPYGSLGENIVIDINPYHLQPGQQLQIGDTVVAITQNCTLCSSLGKVDERLPELLKNDRGIFAKTVQGGKIKKGDTVTIL
ncbi:MOSC domain-containing protein [Sulfurimonas sp. HSL1-2]|uniref:MOSC domain-containing protein n=1 Tax=Thiomicrolovo zhangzhouensis TaxID=3131933 RepID=UPI0031F933B6